MQKLTFAKLRYKQFLWDKSAGACLPLPCSHCPTEEDNLCDFHSEMGQNQVRIPDLTGFSVRICVSATLPLCEEGVSNKSIQQINSIDQLEHGQRSIHARRGGPCQHMLWVSNHPFLGSFLPMFCKRHPMFPMNFVEYADADRGAVHRGGVPRGALLLFLPSD